MGESTIERLARLAGHLPEVSVGPYYDSVALKAFGKGIAGPSREAGALWVYVSQEWKPVLLEASPEVFFQTEHFRNWPALLVREVVDDETLAFRLEAAWRARAPKRVLKAWDAGRGARGQTRWVGVRG